MPKQGKFLPFSLRSCRRQTLCWVPDQGRLDKNSPHAKTVVSVSRQLKVRLLNNCVNVSCAIFPSRDLITLSGAAVDFVSYPAFTVNLGDPGVVNRTLTQTGNVYKDEKPYQFL